MGDHVKLVLGLHAFIDSYTICATSKSNKLNIKRERLQLAQAMYNFLVDNDAFELSSVMRFTVNPGFF